MLEKIVGYFLSRHILTNILFITIVIVGILGWGNIKKEEMPDITFDIVRISASYPGASANEVEHFVTKEIEDELKGIDGIYRVSSTSSQGICSITVELEQGYKDVDAAITEIREAVLDTSLPDDVEDDPAVSVFKTSKKAILDIAMIHKERHLLDHKARTLVQKYADALEDKLTELSYVNSADISGYLDPKINIYIEPEKLKEYNLPMSSVISIVSEGHSRRPAGNIEAKNEPKVTINAQLDTIEKLQKLYVQAGFEGKAVLLRDIAEISCVFERPKEIYKVNGHECVVLKVVKNSSAGILDSVDRVKQEVLKFKKEYLKDVPIDIAMLDDESISVRNRLSLITVNGGIGFALVFIMLFLCLNKRAGFWVGVGIPFTICFTLVAAMLAGYTINNITLSAVIIVMGMVVDDAIVVAENIYRLERQGMSPAMAATKGTSTVFLPVLVSILTTCAAFIPLYFFGGRFSQMTRYIPYIIFIMLGASLFESLFILPGHMIIGTGKNKDFKGNKKNKRQLFDLLEDIYGRILRKVLPFKYIILTFFIAILFLSARIITSDMKFVLFPHEETRKIVLAGECGEFADKYETAQVTKKIEDIIKPYIGKEVIGISTEIAKSRRGGEVEENRFSMTVEIVPKEEREKSADMLAELWKKEIDSIEGLKKIVVQKSRFGQSGGSAIEIVVKDNSDIFREDAANRLASGLKEIDGLINIDIERPINVIEYKIDFDREKLERLSISPSSISAVLRAALEGSTLYNLSEGDDDIDVCLTVSEKAKTDIEKILEIPVENSSDYLVPIRDVVYIEKCMTPNSIARQNYKRVTKVYADIKPNVRTSPIEIANYVETNIFPEVIKGQPSTVLSFAGEVYDTRESGSDFKNASLMVVIFIFAIIAILFDSLTKPIIIMLTIPFGIAGVVIAFWLHGKFMFGFFAAIGCLGLAGVVINDSIVMLTKLESEFVSGAKDAYDQIANIAKTRLKAVALTTLTTVAGVMPTAYGIAGYDAMLADMMLALAWGLIFGTLITLFLVPCLYSIGKKRPKKQKKQIAALIITLIIVPVFFTMSNYAKAAEADKEKKVKVLDIKEFIELAGKHDSSFEKILIDQLSLKYRKDQLIESRDIVMSLKSQYDFNLSQDENSPETSVSLSKLFPYTGTQLSLTYGNAPSYSSGASESDVCFSISQPIAQNAFGRGTKIYDKMIDAETDVLRYQIIEAYEVYLESLISLYYDWYEAYENLKIGRLIYQNKLELLRLAEKRQKQNIALPVDVNKVRLTVLEKKEDLMILEDSYANLTNSIKQSLMQESQDITIVPAQMSDNLDFDIQFEKEQDIFIKESRTVKILNLLEKESQLNIEKAADELLPSVNLFLGYDAAGQRWDIQDREQVIFGGVSLDLPFFNYAKKAENNTLKIEHEKTVLSNINDIKGLYTSLRNLALDINREKRLIEMADNKIEISYEILKDEEKDYAFGRASIDDYIDAADQADQSKFNKISHVVTLRKLYTNWLQLTDRLISADKKGVPSAPHKLEELVD